MVVITMVTDMDMISHQEGVLVEIIEEEMKALGYMLQDMQALTVNKAQ